MPWMGYTEELSRDDMRLITDLLYPHPTDADVVWFDVQPGMPMFHNDTFIGYGVDLLPVAQAVDIMAHVADMVLATVSVSLVGVHAACFGH